MKYWTSIECLPAAQQGFLKAIIEDPDRDDVRLIYADWLEEFGEEDFLARGLYSRSAFIRTQIELAKLWDEQCIACLLTGMRIQHTNAPCGCTEKYKALKAKENYDDCWPDAIPMVVEAIWHDVKSYWWRGFIKTIESSWNCFQKWGPGILQYHPVERVVLTDCYFRMNERRNYSCWYEPPGGSSPSLMDWPLDRDARVSRGCFYLNELYARNALSAVAIDWARSRGVFGEILRWPSSTIGQPSISQVYGLDQPVEGSQE